jgi:hypothetical protein
MCFKYEEFICDLGIECPPPDYGRKERVCFRFVFECSDTRHYSNFLPGPLQPPKRGLLPRTPEDPKDLCMSYALSFFISMDSARRKINSLLKHFKKADIMLGTHIAQGILDQNDGVMSEPNRQGHFSLHEFRNARLDSKFVIIHQM